MYISTGLFNSSAAAAGVPVVLAPDEESEILAGQARERAALKVDGLKVVQQQSVLPVAGTLARHGHAHRNRLHARFD